MSRSRMPLLVGLLGVGLLAVLVVVGTALEQWVLVALGGSGFAAAVLLVQLDTWRRTRSMRNFLRDEIRRSAGDPGARRPLDRAASAVPPPVTQEDVLGTVRLMQAQYTGRLDRLQGALDDALSRLAAEDRRDP